MLLKLCYKNIHCIIPTIIRFLHHFIAPCLSNPPNYLRIPPCSFTLLIAEMFNLCTATGAMFMKIIHLLCITVTVKRTCHKFFSTVSKITNSFALFLCAVIRDKSESAKSQTSVKVFYDHFGQPGNYCVYLTR